MVGRGGDGTGIQYHHVSFPGRVGRCKPMGGQLALQGRPICLSGAAAKTLDKKSGHEGYYNGDFRKYYPLQQLTTNTNAACILLARFKAISRFPLEFT